MQQAAGMCWKVCLWRRLWELVAGPTGGGGQDWTFWFAEAEPMGAVGSKIARLSVQALSRCPS